MVLHNKYNTLERDFIHVILLNEDCAITQTVICQLVTMEILDHIKGSKCKFLKNKVAIDQTSLQGLWFPFTNDLCM